MFTFSAYTNIMCIFKHYSRILLVRRIETGSALSNARNLIQQKYLKALKTAPEACNLPIVEVPLLPSEITGPEKLLEFSNFLVPKGYRAAARPQLLVDRQAKATVLYERSVEMGFVEGEKVRLCNLNKSPHYNGVVGEVAKVSQDGRIVIRVKDPESEKFKVLSLKPDNLEVLSQQTKFL